MTFKVLATGSNGNCYVLTSADGEILLLDVGIKFEKILNGIDFRLNDIVGICLSHEHKDHSLSADKFKKLGIPIADDIGSYKFGGFKIKTFSLVHDVPCIGFYINHAEMGNLIYITDTEYCKYKFQNINHILVECNYDASLLGHDHPAKNHILTGHMELQTVKNFVWANKNENLKTVLLCHMSRTNLDFEKALETIRQIFPDAQMVYEGMEVEVKTYQ